jgi:hypothetical protein
MISITAKNPDEYPIIHMINLHGGSEELINYHIAKFVENASFKMVKVMNDDKILYKR